MDGFVCWTGESKDVVSASELKTVKCRRSRSKEISVGYKAKMLYGKR